MISAWTRWVAASRLSISARSAVRCVIASSSAARLASSRCDSVTKVASAALSPLVLFMRPSTVARSTRFSSIEASALRWSAMVLALMKRAAVAEISREITESRMASSVTGTCRAVTSCRPLSTVSNDHQRDGGGDHGQAGHDAEGDLKLDADAETGRRVAAPRPDWSPGARETSAVQRSLQLRDIGASGNSQAYLPAVKPHGLRLRRS